ncbi:MAG: SDR family oxidoreductase [Alphaproteobacteria bacterium]|jgi:NAD(P)-dependent dehydrogenase (short-subunit alcohol dehydrogenase family)|nr:SDR family oxidoreductase [Alphaproteobacteria bacterium]MDP6829452.1 SDR family oxidoreductase [Alphaproteobacteria bacterium]
MQGLVVVITGGSDGIGYVCARELALQGAKVIIVGRNSRKCADAASALQNSTNNTEISFEVADLSLMREVRALARRLSDGHGHIDVLLNNAGAYYRQRQETAEGLEYTFALNHMAYFILSDLLLPSLGRAKQGRIINVASRAHRNGTVNFDDLQGSTNYQGWPAYCQSKLMNIMFTHALARRLEDTAITANSLHPGFVRSKFGHNNPGLTGLIVRLSQALLAISVEAGAKTSVHAAAAPELAETSGAYFNKCRAVASSPESMDEAAQERLWRISAEVAARIS